METDVIVNAANSSLMGGGGVDGAIHRQGGPRILEECIEIRRKQWPAGLPTGKAVITTGGSLTAKWVIHTVGPIWQGGNRGECEFLRQAYENSLQLAFDKGLRSVAFPSIGPCAYGYPIEKACRVAIQAVNEFLCRKNWLQKVMLVLFSERDLQIYQSAASEILK